MRPLDGSIAFGLVSAPVRMYPAIGEQGLSFHAYEDRCRSRLLEVIERKRRGGATAPVPQEAPDLLAALRERASSGSDATALGRAATATARAGSRTGR